MFCESYRQRRPKRNTIMREVETRGDSCERRMPLRRCLWLIPITAILGLSILPLALGRTSSGLAEGKPLKTFGRRGTSPGRLQKPRAIAVDAQNELYIVDMTARIQVFDQQGNYLRGWQTPESENGRPSGLSIGRDGNVLVADTHYFRVLTYTPQGELLADKTLGGTLGQAPGEFGLVTDAVQDSQGNYYVAEYGEYDRIQKFSPAGEFLLQWGGHGEELGQFIRPQNLAVDEHDHIWVADACNHRIQVFDATGREAQIVRHWGVEGNAPGQLKYPYDLTLDDDGHVYVCEFGNHRIQKFTLDGELLGWWGNIGRDPGQLHNPWGLVRNSRGRLYVLDTYNHRVQILKL
jgi:DNA-binding beta-propeller fold protein YncE